MNKKSSVDDSEIYFEDEDIEIYSKKRIEEFLKEDKLSSVQSKKLKTGRDLV